MYKRPTSVPLGQIWNEFTKRDKYGQELRFQIRDIELEEFQSFVKFLQTQFLEDEPLCIACDVTSDPTSLRSIEEIWIRAFNQRLSVGCYVEEDGLDKMVGGCLCEVIQKGDSVIEIKGEPWKKVYKAVGLIEDPGVFELCGTDRFFSCSVLSVHRDWRGLSIGTELLNASEKICQAIGIYLISATCTAKASQIIARKCNYDLLCEFPMSSLKENKMDIELKDPEYGQVYVKDLSKRNITRL